MKLSVIFVLCAFEFCAAERILFVLPAPSKSHYILHEQLMEKMAEKGHEVTVIAPFKKSKPFSNIREIIVPNISDFMFKTLVSANPKEGKFEMRKVSPFIFLSVGKMGEAFMDSVMNESSVKELLNSDQKFDLLVGETFMMEGLLAGLAYRFKAPMALISPSIPFTYANEIAGNPAPPAYIPDPSLGLGDTMTFFQRLKNFFQTTFLKLVFYNVLLPQQNSLLKKYFGEDAPHLMDLLSNNSLILVNHHFSLAYPRPYLPNMVEIGGYHVRPPKPLPKDLQKFMDDAKDGVIYFSMGSNLRSDEFPKEKFEGILKAFAKLKQRVLWKFEDENPPNLPKNVKISKWLPQSDILAHPNVKLFITHGGLLSTTESIFRGVPILGIPIFADQPANINLVEKIGVGLKLDYDDISEESFSKSIQELLNNPKYGDNAKFRSKLLLDRPLPPVETAVYWLEYVMRYKGTPHLRSGALNLRWYQLYMLDVFAFLGIALYAFAYCVKIIFRFLKTLRGGVKKETSSKEKKS